MTTYGNSRYGRGTHVRAAGEVLHEHAGHLGQVGGAARAGHVLVRCAAQHGVQRVPQLVEQVVHRARRQQRRARAVPAAQRQHHHHRRVLRHTLLHYVLRLWRVRVAIDPFPSRCLREAMAAAEVILVRGCCLGA